MIYDNLRGKTQPKVRTPHILGGSKHVMWKDKVKRTEIPYLGGSIKAWQVEKKEARRGIP